MTDDVAARLRAFLAEFPGISVFDPDDITELLDEHDQLRAENAQIEGLENSVRNYEQWLAEECRKTEALQAQVARIRAFLEDMAGWCSPHGVAADYARRGLDALDGIDSLTTARACSCGRNPDPGICQVEHSAQHPAGGHCACACNKETT